MSRQQLPCASQTQRALLGIILQFPNRLSDCDRFGINDTHFQGVELELWQEIVWAEADGRPFDMNSLSDHLRNTRSSSNEAAALVGSLAECYSAEGVPAMLPDYCRTLVETKERRTACTLGEKLAAAARGHGDGWRDLIDRLASIGTDTGKEGFPKIVDAADLCANPPPIPPEVIEGVLHRGGKLVLGGGSKSFKTWTLMGLSLGVAAGTEFLGFECKRGRVFYVNLEIPEAFFTRRLGEICKAKGISLEKGSLDVLNLRGYAADAAVLLPRIIRMAKKMGYALIILDPIYKMLGERDENASRDMADLMNLIERMTVQTGAAVAFGSHFAKGNASGKESMDRISGSDVFARDPDSIMTMTRHEVEGCFSVEMTLRNHPPQMPFVVRWRHPLMVVEPLLDPAKLKQKPGCKEIVSAEEVLNELGDDALTFSDWCQKATETLLISNDTFKRRLRELKKTARVGQSPMEGNKYVKA